MARNILRPGGYTPGMRANDMETVVRLLAGAVALLEGRLACPALADQVAALRDEAAPMAQDMRDWSDEEAARVLRELAERYENEQEATP